MGLLYVDGHVRAYHGAREIPKTHVARMRISMPATTDYWVNDAKGEPLFVVPTEANRGLVERLPAVLTEVRKLVGDRRVTVVFDRGGWSPELFAQILDGGFDLLTYRKAPFRRLPRSRFAPTKATLDGRKIEYLLADQGIYLEYGRKKKRKRVHLRQVTRLSEDGHQTPVLTSRRDLSALEVAYRMFERWRQENFFKYLREEFALDALVDYGTEPADATREVPNPERKKIDAEIRQARARLEQIQAHYGLAALDNPERLRPTMRGFKGRTLVQSALSAGGDIEVTDDELLVSIDPLSSPHKTHALARACEQLNAIATLFPGTHLNMRFAIKPEPPRSHAFPGPRIPSTATQPDIRKGG